MPTRNTPASRAVQATALAAVNASVYGIAALYYCFVQLYLGKFHTPVEVGVLISIGQAVGIVSPMIWGVLADKAKFKNTMLFLVVAASAVSYYAMSFSESFLWHAVTISLTLFFISPFNPLVDTISIEHCYHAGLNYGPIRLMGTVSYGVIAFALSFFLEKNLNYIFYLALLIAALNCLFMLFTPKVAGHSNRKKLNILPLFREKYLMFIFVLVATSTFTWYYYLNFFPAYLTGELGLPDWVWGLNVMITVLGEIPFFLLFTRLFDRFGIKKILFVGAALTVARYFLLASFTGASWLLLTGALTGVSISMIPYCGSIYISANIPEEMNASAQSLMFALPSGLAKVLAGVLGGLMTTAFGTRNSLYLCGAISTAALLFCLIAFGKKAVFKKA